jgi:hypothetical protein
MLSLTRRWRGQGLIHQAAWGDQASHVGEAGWRTDDSQNNSGCTLKVLGKPFQTKTQRDSGLLKRKDEQKNE